MVSTEPGPSKSLYPSSWPYDSRTLVLRAGFSQRMKTIQPQLYYCARRRLSGRRAEVARRQGRNPARDYKGRSPEQLLLCSTSTPGVLSSKFWVHKPDFTSVRDFTFAPSLVIQTSQHGTSSSHCRDQHSRHGQRQAHQQEKTYHSFENET